MKTLRTKDFRFLVISIILLALLLAKTTQHVNAENTTDALIKFSKGDLLLESVPDFDFGTNDIETSTQAYALEGELAPIQIHDLRGTHEGWTLKVSLSEFKDEQEKTSLKGAILGIEAASVSALYGTTAAAPAPSAASFQLTAGGTEVALLEAAIDSGSGVWQMSFAKDNVSLNVITGTASSGTNTATLAWSLESTP
jgi:hypothetical protein